MGQKADEVLQVDPEVEVDGLGGSSGVVEAGQGDRARLVAGQITRAQYLDLSVQRATAHLEGTLEMGRLAAMREILRAELEHDPFLDSLVSRATIL